MFYYGNNLHPSFYFIGIQTFLELRIQGEELHLTSRNYFFHISTKPGPTNVNPLFLFFLRLYWERYI